VPIVAILKRIDTLCGDDFWKESVPGVDDSLGEVVRSGWTVLCELAFSLWLWPLVLLAGPLAVSELVREFRWYQLIWLALLANLKYWIRSPRCLLASRVEKNSR